MIRHFLVISASLVLGNHMVAGEPGPKPGHKNPIQIENEKLGSLDWQLTRVRVDKSGFRSPLIEGYCSKQSVVSGETLQIMVSTTPAARFKIEIFRTGYYAGRGARLMTTLGPFDGKPQPVPPVGERSLRECKWEACAYVKIPNDWVSGVYLGRLTTIPDTETEPYWQSYIVFIVRDERPVDVLFQCSDNTWQAYNQWPDKYSVYTNPKGNQGPWSDVSFDRPYAKYAQIYDNPQSIGSGEWLCFEFPLAYWLEKQGYDVAYCSNSDMLTPERGLKCKAFLSVAHDEYWDIRAYRSVEKLRDAGVNLLFLSGNAVCWVTPLKPSTDGRPSRIMFRGGPFGGKHKWAEDREKDHGPFPHRGPDEGYLIGARNVEPVNGGGDWIVAKPDHWMFKGTGMKKGDRVPGLIGWEYHGDPPADLPGLEIVAEGTAFQGGTRPQHWTATFYPGPKSNFVFNGSTIWWPQAMSSPPGHMLPWSHWSRPHGPDERVHKITDNLLRRAIAGLDARKPAIKIIDAHTHFYDPHRPQGVPWPGKDDKLLYRTVLPDEFKKLTREHGVASTIVVEASPWVEDNQWLLNLAAKDPFIVGVVGRLDPQGADFVKHLERFVKDARFVGIRVNHDELRRGLDDKRFLDNLRLLIKHGRTLDVNGGPEMPADVARLAKRLPELRIVIDHAANVNIDGKPVPTAWLDGMRAAAANKSVWCKVSALVESTGRNKGDAPTEAEYYRPILDALWDTFGEDRLIYASNWPVCEHAARYATVQAIARNYVETRGTTAAEKFFARNAAAAYRLRSLAFSARGVP